MKTTCEQAVFVIRVNQQLFQILVRAKNTLLRLTVMAFLFSGLDTSFGQGAFENLDFEQAIIISAPNPHTPADAFNPISADAALPYWTVSEDGTNCNAVWGTPTSLDETSVALVAAGYSPIQGSYSVQLSAYADAPSGYYRSSSISQTGLIPAGTKSIEFLIASPFQAGSVQPNPVVTINGTAIELTQLSQSGNVITMGGDISAFAGSTVTLAFLCGATRGGAFPANNDIFNLDNIQFSTQIVPEPSACALFALVMLFLGWRFRKVETG
jgi:hypothetical protein